MTRFDAWICIFQASNLRLVFMPPCGGWPHATLPRTPRPGHSQKPGPGRFREQAARRPRKSGLLSWSVGGWR